MRFNIVVVLAGLGPALSADLITGAIHPMPTAMPPGPLTISVTNLYGE